MHSSIALLLHLVTLFERHPLGSNNTFLFLVNVAGQTGPHSPNVSTERAPKPGDLPKPTQPSIEISTNTSQNKQSHQIPSNKQEINLGRHPSNDIVIDEPVVSGFHFQLKRENNQLV